MADRFVLEREVGSGGMSTVYLGRDEVLGRSVAVKVLKSGLADTDVGDRFQREGKTAARLSHANIVPVYDAGEGEIGGREVSYIVMEHVSGGDLKDLLDKRGPLGAKELSRIGREVAAGLAHAHNRGIVHRDIKPHNILLDGAGRPKLTDFGIARALEATRMTQTGSYLGTALYSSPEQLRGENITTKSDVYSLGATLYQAAVGAAPFQGSAIEVAEKHISNEPRPPGELRPGVDESLATLILACLAKDPEERPSANEVETRLAAVAGPRFPDEAAGAGAAAPSHPGGAGDDSNRENRDASSAGGSSAGKKGSRGVIAAIAVVAVLALVGLVAAPSLFGGGTEESASQNEAPQNEAPQQNAAPQEEEAAPPTPLKTAPPRTTSRKRPKLPPSPIPSKKPRSNPNRPRTNRPRTNRMRVDRLRKILRIRRVLRIPAVFLRGRRLMRSRVFIRRRRTGIMGVRTSF
ncbi:MAG: serine/threonine protein kinase [Actinomycetota bacterium]|nr:serine/threonine protein kinase [Actinomycetota bacterium]